MDHIRIYHPDFPPFLLELARTDALLRLRDVGMNCGCEYTAFPRFRGLRPYSRYQHSLGVALIVWHFTGDAAQAAAGLLHDAATPVFAHVVDFLRGDYLHQEATEAGTAAVIAGCAGLRAALNKHGLPLEAVVDYHRYPLADNETPRLSADRLEYTLGNAVNFGFCEESEAAALYGDLCAAPGGGELAFQSPAAGERFARLALRCSKVYVSDEDRYAMQILSELLGDALARGVLREDELRGTEPAVVEKLLRDGRSAAAWRRFRALSVIRRAESPGPEEGWRRIYAKKRRIDPLILGRGRASVCFPAFGAELAAFLAQSQDDWLLGEGEAER